MVTNYASQAGGGWWCVCVWVGGGVPRPGMGSEDAVGFLFSSRGEITALSSLTISPSPSQASGLSRSPSGELGR